MARYTWMESYPRVGRGRDTSTAYLQVGRLADVLALIQVLAVDSSGYRSADGVEEEMQRKTSTGGSWIDLAKEHPEFFRVRDPERPEYSDKERTARVVLLPRYVAAAVTDKDGKERRPVLEVTYIVKLMELAIQLHGNQQAHRDRWRAMLPIVTAIVAAAATIVAAILKP